MELGQLPRETDLGELLEDRESYLRDGIPPARVRRVVLDSWARSKAHGVNPRVLRQQNVATEALQTAVQRNEALLRAAEAFLEIMHRSLAEQPHIVALGDRDACILRLLKGPGLDERDLAATNLVEGASWHERDIGCNGIGTCLAIGEPVILTGAEHFQQSYVGWTCIGAPIRDAGGAIAGALDLSVPNEHAHVHAWGWTLSVARGIESALAGHHLAEPLDVGQIAGDPERPLGSVAATFDLLAARLPASGANTRLLEEARAELEEAERHRITQIRQLSEALRGRIHAEQALAHDREFLRRLFDSIPVMVTLYDPAVQQIHLNPHVTKVVGWTNEDVRNADVMELCYPDPEYREKVRAFMQVPGPTWLDIEMTAKDGTKVPTTWANIRLTDDRQVGIGVDLTDRKKTELDLQRAYEAAQRALEEHDSVLAVVSHDLRNPLHTLRMASSLLLEDLPEEEKQAQIEIIRRSIDHMTRLIEDLLDAARIEGGGLQLNPGSHAADALIESAVDQMAPLARAAAVRLRLGQTTDAPVRSDRTRIAQVFSNLIGNAIQHTPEDGEIVVEALPAGSEVRFSIRDSGHGIAPADLERVFDRYWQAQQTRNAGAGLGLAIAKGVVEAHGGRMWAESRDGGGAVFHFTLPVAAA